MRLATKSGLAVGIAAGALSALVALMLWAHSVQREAGREYLQADEVRRHVHHFSILILEGLQRPSPRVQTQWQYEIGLVQKSLASLEALQPGLTARLSERLYELSRAFNDVTRSKQEPTEALQRIKVGRIIARLQEVSSITTQFVQKTSARRREAEQALLATIWASVLSSIIGLPCLWFGFRRAALLPLQSLTEEIAQATVEKPLKDDASLRRDEFGDLRHEYSETQRRLRDAYLDIQEKANRLERSNKELDSFAYVASHDLKAPLRVIDNSSRWLEEDLEPFLNEDTRESLALLRNRVARMDQLLDDLLEHSRIGRAEPSRTLVGGRDLIEDVIILAAAPEGLRIRANAGFDAIKVPSVPLRTVLLNLVSNAVKHHDREEGRIDISVIERPGWLEFAVCDDGPGIPNQHRNKVFEMFQTLKPRDQVEGSGMGLAIVKKTVELAGGHVWLPPTEGRGCTVLFSWPSATSSTQKEEATHERAYSNARPEAHRALAG
ncbi:MAG: ATP-binding protein [Pseudomonadota bacterium]